MCTEEDGKSGTVPQVPGTGECSPYLYMALRSTGDDNRRTRIERKTISNAHVFFFCCFNRQNLKGKASAG